MQTLSSQRSTQSRSRAGRAAVLLAALTVAAAGAEGVARLEISQALQLDRRPATVRLYLVANDAEDRPVAELGAEQLTATLGEQPLAVEALAPFDPAAEGIAYVFLVDVSKSLSDREFDLILEALDVWILSLGPRDRVAVVSFGDVSRLVVDFTRDTTKIQAGLRALGPTDDRTALHEALRDGLELCSRRDPDLPGRRVLMVLTDGRDEGSGLTDDDVLDLVRTDPVPVYAIGLSRIQNPAERRRYLEQLNRLAANSGGAFFEGSTATLGTAYESIRSAIRGVWTADLLCAACPLDGEARRLQLLLTDGERILSAGRRVRLLPTPAAVAATAPDPSAGSTSGTEAPPVDPEPAPPTAGEETGPASIDAETGGGRGGRWLWLLALLAALAGGAAWAWRRVRAAQPPAAAASIEEEVGADARPPAAAPKPAPAASEPRPAPSASDRRPSEPADKTAAADESGPDSGSVPIPAPYTTESGIETTRPPRPTIMRLVRMIVVRGSKPGRQYALTLFQSAIVGSRSTCDCVLVDPGVEPEQFEISQRDGRVYLRNLAAANPTLVDGVPQDPAHPLTSGSLIGNRDFIVRLVYEDARPINT